MIPMPDSRRTLKTCIVCGGEFMGGWNAKYCEHCKASQNDTDKPKVWQGRPQVITFKKKKQNSGKSIREILAELEAYNREHGTKYTYGQYIELIEGR